MVTDDRDYLRDSVKLAENFYHDVTVRFDVNGKYLVDVPHLSKRESRHILTSVCGRGETIQLACRDFLNSCVGHLVYDPGEKTAKRVEIICVGIL